jgi:signal transduction histidine kinase
MKIHRCHVDLVMSLNNIYKALSPKAVLTWGILLALFFSFSLYVYTEKNIDRANQIRQISYQLADQLRQSSDDQTRMVRAYVVTGLPKYRKYHQDILDIRDGKMPRPKGYFQVYWDIILANSHPTLIGNGNTIALLDLMRQAGFTQDEMLKLSEAKANVDILTNLEFEAIKLVKPYDSNSNTSREKALNMLHDEHYHQAKERIMRPINAFYAQMDKRTIAGIHQAERIAFIFRLLFIFAALWSAYILWRAYLSLHTKLGASVSEVQSHLRRIGSGDLSAVISISPNMQHSILGGLAEMQNQLRAFNAERKQLENAREEALNRLHHIATQETRHRMEQSKFIAMLTHELKNPIATIKLAVSALSDKKCTNIDCMSLGHIGLAVGDMDAIIDRCIQADKVDQGGVHINLSTFLLLPYVNEIARNLNALTRLDVTIPVSLSLNSDTMMFRLIMNNLLENALKYSPPNSRVSIDTSAKLSNINQSGVIISVSNEIGKAGAPDESRVFERYYRSSAAQRQSGTGLGLWLVKSFATQLGGQVVYVPLDNRVTFQVWLPQ